MAHHNEFPTIVIERRSGVVAPFLWGALVGAGVALLYAPRAGRETQRELRDSLDRVRYATTSRVDDAREAVSDTIGGVRQRVQDKVDAVRDAVENRVEGVRNAVDSGRRAARDARGELERRVADAKRAASDTADSLAAAPDLDEPNVDIVVTEVIVEEPPTRPELS